MSPCIPFKTKDGIVGIACTRGGRKKCRWCSGPGAFLCDGPSERLSGTCDAPMCGHHKTTIDGKDYCPDCAPKYRKRKGGSDGRR